MARALGILLALVALVGIIDAGTARYLDQAGKAVLTSASHELRGRAVLANLPVELPAGWEVTFIETPSIEGVLGLTYTDGRIEVVSGDQVGLATLQHVLAHEVGHAIDVTHLDDSARDEWADARGFDAQWWPETLHHAFDSGAENFAEDYAACTVGNYYNGALAPAPTQAQCEALQEIIR